MKSSTANCTGDVMDIFARYPRRPDAREDWLGVCLRLIEARGVLRRLATTVHLGFDAKDEAAAALTLCDALDADFDQWLAERDAAASKKQAALVFVETAP